MRPLFPTPATSCSLLLPPPSLASSHFNKTHDITIPLPTTSFATAFLFHSYARRFAFVPRRFISHLPVSPILKTSSTFLSCCGSLSKGKTTGARRVRPLANPTLCLPLPHRRRLSKTYAQLIASSFASPLPSMFYSEQLLAKTGPLARVWLASNVERKLSKSQILQSDIQSSVGAIVDQGHAPMALRLSGQLMLGVVRIYGRKARYLLDDCNDALIKIRMVSTCSREPIPIPDPPTDIQIDK